ncbi:MAG TPA: type II secretion system protein, partial [Candidatus Saccharimonadales bacterium]|nr:type II secretion system protein [Candidatus Saccharimonadales bacterium]
MRTASKLVKHQTFRRRISSGKVDGFTIVETMIVLAVTAALFLLAVISVSGRQNETEFQQAINDVGSTFQQIINQVDSGNYQEAQKVNCTNVGNKPNVTDASASTTDTEGTSTDCMFVGKIVQFATHNADPQQFIIYPVAGLRKDPSTGLNCIDIDCTKPAMVAPGNSGNGSFPDQSVTKFLHNGLSVVSMQFKNGASI